MCDVRCGGSPRDVSDSVLDQILRLYSTPLLLAEDASKAAAFLYIAQSVFPAFFDPSNPFSPVECMLIAGNVSVPPVMRLSESPSRWEIHGLQGLPGHPFEDSRVCDLCLQRGDSIESGRMLCTLTGDWVHLNCVYYSSNISIDSKNGAIQKYTQMKNKSRSTRCCICDRTGASIRCCFQNCPYAFHFACGREKGCLIRVNKEAFCPRHRPGQRSRNRVSEEDLNPPKSALSTLPIPAKSSFRSTPTPSSTPSRPLDYRVAVGNMELFTTRFNYRVVFPPLKLCVCDWTLILRKLFSGEYLRLGALTVTHLGTVSRSPYMHNRNYLFPDQYRSFRIYWSTHSIGEV